MSLRTPEEIADEAIAEDTAQWSGMEIPNADTVREIVINAIRKDREQATATMLLFLQESEVPEAGDYRDGTEAEDTGGF
ncbi:hypothetical protein SEA_A3WALLY_341 [Microbacterium phage A3Wally]|nr:hypothetical protein SEA_A3WALLY_341 [Microbacterium phage A3Wally]